MISVTKITPPPPSSTYTISGLSEQQAIDLYYLLDHLGPPAGDPEHLGAIRQALIPALSNVRYSQASYSIKGVLSIETVDRKNDPFDKEHNERITSRNNAERNI